MNFKHCLIAAATLALGLQGAALAGGHKGQAVSKVEDLPARNGDWSPEEIARGREQLVAAIDAAWIRIIADGRDQEVLKTEPANMPGAA
ncbi:MAG: hypothetical protein V2J12_01140, partial [Gammaproteobacteria bacterium]|nr:hypothetical protein [Gammaproteobacteria bacterium]